MSIFSEFQIHRWKIVEILLDEHLITKTAKAREPRPRPISDLINLKFEMFSLTERPAILLPGAPKPETGKLILGVAEELFWFYCGVKGSNRTWYKNKFKTLSACYAQLKLYIDAELGQEEFDLENALKTIIGDTEKTLAKFAEHGNSISNMAHEAIFFAYHLLDREIENHGFKVVSIKGDASKVRQYSKCFHRIGVSLGLRGSYCGDDSIKKAIENGERIMKINQPGLFKDEGLRKKSSNSK